ncbi:hypothetical protein JOE57_000394 [Microlunatus panaciterrae]|uniref:Uncharacterized protein n=1 Tax=Microlunatus panaciterrae TaxID=400768 RepID=A0ABS2REP7_9ACTN|nr:hypothetical protein [Microlunatus panaciterrae]MBM7797473.1 hypothetical protein [Microlunatus panaciterrae]
MPAGEAPAADGDADTLAVDDGVEGTDELVAEAVDRADADGVVVSPDDGPAQADTSNSASAARVTGRPGEQRRVSTSTHPGRL